MKRNTNKLKKEQLCVRRLYSKWGGGKSEKINGNISYISYMYPVEQSLEVDLPGFFFYYYYFIIPSWGFISIFCLSFKGQTKIGASVNNKYTNMSICLMLFN